MKRIIASAQYRGVLNEVGVRHLSDDFSEFGFRIIYSPNIVAAVKDKALIVIDIDAGHGFRYPLAGDSKEYLEDIIDNYDTWNEFRDWLCTNYAEYDIDTLTIDIPLY